MAVRFALNRKGVAQIMLGKHGSVVADLTRRANAIRSAADAASGGPNHAVEVKPGRNRVRAVVYTDTFHGMRREATDRTLTRSVDAGRA